MLYRKATLYLCAAFSAAAAQVTVDFATFTGDTPQVSSAYSALASYGQEMAADPSWTRYVSVIATASMPTPTEDVGTRIIDNISVMAKSMNSILTTTAEWQAALPTEVQSYLISAVSVQADIINSVLGGEEATATGGARKKGEMKLEI